MIDPKQFLRLLKKNGINLFCGVPDSCVAPFLRELKKEKNYVLANEGLAVSFGAGYNLATNKIPLVYLQNSGLGNATDPLTNLTNKEVYKIPMVLLIGWRGYPGTKDEPQHIIQGKIVKKTINSFNIPSIELKGEKSFSLAQKLIDICKNKSKTVAIFVNKKTFKKSGDKIILDKKKTFRRNFLTKIIKKTKSNDKIISSVGYNSREIYQILKDLKLKRKVFYLIGAMGHTSSLALAYNIFQRNRVICIDGDGSFLMHLGSLVSLGNLAKNNFKYILFENQSHESVGNIDLKYKVNYKKLSESVGFNKFISIDKINDTEKKFDLFFKSKEKTFMLIKINVGTFDKLLRIKELDKIKERFVK